MGSNHWRSSRRCQNRLFFLYVSQVRLPLSAAADHVEESWENSARKIRRLTEFVIFVLCFYLINDLWLWRRINLVINSERRMFHDASTWHRRQIFLRYRVQHRLQLHAWSLSFVCTTYKLDVTPNKTKKRWKFSHQIHCNSSSLKCETMKREKSREFTQMNNQLINPISSMSRLLVGCCCMSSGLNSHTGFFCLAFNLTRNLLSNSK